MSPTVNNNDDKDNDVVVRHRRDADVATAPPTTTILKIQKDSVAGAPVTCLSLPRPNVCIYGQGPFLHRNASWNPNNNNGADGSGGNSDDSDGRTGGNNNNNYIIKEEEEERLLVSSLQQGNSCTSIHGIRYNNDHNHNNVNATSTSTSDVDNTIAVVFGGRSLALIQNTLQTNIPMKEVTVSETPPSSSPSCWILSDWIWDCQFLQTTTKTTTTKTTTRRRDDRNASSSEDDGDISLVLCVGLAHNSVQIWEVSLQLQKNISNDNNRQQSTDNNNMMVVRQRQRRLLRHIRGGQNHHHHGITYCMNISTKNNMVAVGSVVQEIHVWSFNDNTDDDNNDDDDHYYDRLCGHEGVIHSVRFNKYGTKLISASDDRTIRLWKYSPSTTTSSSPSSSCWSLQWTAYGHTARCWDVKFTSSILLSSSSSDDEDDNLVLSTGEDGTLRIWGSQDGSPIAVLRGHASLSIWSVDIDTTCRSPCSGTIVTGANDGSVAIYNLRDYVEYGNNTGGSSRQVVTTKTYMVPFSSGADIEQEKGPSNVNNTIEEQQQEQTDAAVTSEKKRKRKPQRKRNKVSQHVIVGLEFFKKPVPPATNITAVSTPANNYVHSSSSSNATVSLLVATRLGSMFCLDAVQEKWTELEPWWHSPVNNNTSNNHNDIQPYDGCCLSIHPSGAMAAIGSIHGDILLVPLQQRITARTNNMDNYQQQPTILCGRKYKTVQKLQWIDNNQLLSYHVQAIVLWCSTGAVPAGSGGSETYCYQQTRIFQINTKGGMPISSAFNRLGNLLVVGDTRGSLSLFDLQQEEEEEEEEDDVITEQRVVFHNPVSVLYRVHGKEHVTAVHWNSGGDSGYGDQQPNNSHILSAGNNGRIDEFIVVAVDDKNDNKSKLQLQPLISVPLSPYSGIDRLWSQFHNCTYSNSVVAGGYFGNLYVVKDILTGYEFFRLQTGGRQRAYSMDISNCSNSDINNNNNNNSNGVDTIARFAVAINRTDGQHEVQLTCLSVYGLQGWNEEVGKNKEGVLQQQQQPYRLGVGFHSETIYDSCLFSIGKCNGNNSLALLTASEDCSSRISFLHRQGGGYCLASSKLLPLQESGARAVCTSSGSQTATTRTNAPEHSAVQEKTLAIVGGAKLTLQFFLITADTVGDAKAPFPSSLNVPAPATVVKFLGYGRPPEKATIDHRINTVTSIPLANDYHLVAAGDSNGSCYLYHICCDDEILRENNNMSSSSRKKMKASNILTGQLLFRSVRPILSSKFILVGSRILLLSGTTAGDLSMMEVLLTTPVADMREEDGVSVSESSNASKKKSNAPSNSPVATSIHLLQCKPHQMGTNYISARQVKILENETSSARAIIRICSGGDCQSIFCCDVSLSSNDHNYNHNEISTETNMNNKSTLAAAEIIQSTTVERAAASAIRGIHWCDDGCHLISTGYDQRIKAWKLNTLSISSSSCHSNNNNRSDSKYSLRCVATENADVGDVNCLALIGSCCSHDDNGEDDDECITKNKRYTAAIGGAGVELLSFSLP